MFVCMFGLRMDRSAFSSAKMKKTWTKENMPSFSPPAFSKQEKVDLKVSLCLKC